jgi:hypothetical protein
MIDEMAILLGGRGAEKLVFGNASSSSAGDLIRVGTIANRMVRELGMSDVLGPIGYGQDFDENGYAVTYSEETARTIDAEARRLVDRAQHHVGDDGLGTLSFRNQPREPARDHANRAAVLDDLGGGRAVSPGLGRAFEEPCDREGGRGRLRRDGGFDEVAHPRLSRRPRPQLSG